MLTRHSWRLKCVNFCTYPRNHVLPIKIKFCNLLRGHHSPSSFDRFAKHGSLVRNWALPLHFCAFQKSMLGQKIPAFFKRMLPTFEKKLQNVQIFQHLSPKVCLVSILLSNPFWRKFRTFSLGQPASWKKRMMSGETLCQLCMWIDTRITWWFSFWNSWLHNIQTRGHEQGHADEKRHRCSLQQLVACGLADEHGVSGMAIACVSSTC